MDVSQLTLNMKVLLHPCVSVLMEFGDASLPDLQRFLDDDRNAGLLARARATHAFRKHREFFEYEFDQSDYHATKRAICKKIQSLLNYQSFYNLTVGKIHGQLADVHDLVEGGDEELRHQVDVLRRAVMQLQGVDH